MCRRTDSNRGPRMLEATALPIVRYVSLLVTKVGQGRTKAHTLTAKCFKIIFNHFPIVLI